MFLENKDLQNRAVAVEPLPALRADSRLGKDLSNGLTFRMHVLQAERLELRLVLTPGMTRTWMVTEMQGLES